MTSATSAAYGNAVLSTSPEDFWPLSDTAGPTGFSDGPAASFTGSGSQIAIPGGYWAGTGAESAELWFSTSTSKGTLLSSGTGPVGGNPVNLWITGGCLEGTIGATDLNFTSFLGNTCVAGTITDRSSRLRAAKRTSGEVSLSAKRALACSQSPNPGTAWNAGAGMGR